jgi:D-sedoheptulose 7-phosphate isomerase
VLIGISTSGNSNNVLRAIEAAKKRNIFTIGLLGKDGGKIGRISDLNLIVESNSTPRIQEMHIFIIHTICQIVEEGFCG